VSESKSGQIAREAAKDEAAPLFDDATLRRLQKERQGRRRYPHRHHNTEIRPEDLMEAPEFAARGGFFRARRLIGARLPALLEELTDTLIA
jgi:hypothetical protein